MLDFGGRRTNWGTAVPAQAPWLRNVPCVIFGLLFSRHCECDAAWCFGWMFSCNRPHHVGAICLQCREL